MMGDREVCMADKIIFLAGRSACRRLVGRQIHHFTSQTRALQAGLNHWKALAAALEKKELLQIMIMQTLTPTT